MEVLLPSSARPGGRTSTRSGAGIAAVHSEAEDPLDWSLIESALSTTKPAAHTAQRLVDRDEPKPHSSKALPLIARNSRTKASKPAGKCMRSTATS